MLAQAQAPPCAPSAPSDMHAAHAALRVAAVAAAAEEVLAMVHRQRAAWEHAEDSECAPVAGNFA